VASIIIAPLVVLILVLSSAYLFYRWEWKAFIIFIPIIAVTVYPGSLSGDVATFLAPIILGGTGGYTFKKEKSLMFYTLIVSLSLTVLFSANYYQLKLVENIDILDQSKVEMMKMIETSKVPEDQKKELLGDFDMWLEMMKDIIPFGTFIYSVLFSALSFYVVKSFLQRTVGAKAISGLELFRLNDYFIFVLIAGWAVVLLIDKSDYYIPYLTGLNCALIATLLYIIQSLGVIKFYLMKRGFPPYLAPLFLVLLVLMGKEVTAFGAILLAGLGTLDFWADFRKLDKPKPE
jgi:uncharacterized protein YybS (DUF2232 family)